MSVSIICSHPVTTMNTLPLSLPAHETELLPSCEDHSSSSGSSTSAQLLVAHPQHSTASSHAVDDCSAPSEQFHKEQHVNDRKRSFATVHTDSNLTSPVAAATFTEVQLPESSLPPKPPSSNKKRRVTFCKTTKPPSDLNKQCPLNNINKLILPNNIMKHSVSCTSLPQPNNIIQHSVSCPSLPQLSSSPLLVSEPSTGELDLNVSPAIFVNTIVLQSKSTTGSIRGEDIISDASKRVKLESYYLPFADEHLEAYTRDKVNAVQGNDVETLRSLLKSGHLMQASNRFGESLLHTSCRRGFTETVEFFLNEAKVCPRVRDDMGRTPMHDVCWSSAAPNHEIMKMFICAAPEMLLSKDKRGHSPFDYARREHWPNWVSFLNDHRQLIVNSLVSSFLESSDDIRANGSECGGLRCMEDSVSDQ